LTSQGLYLVRNIPRTTSNLRCVSTILKSGKFFFYVALIGPAIKYKHHAKLDPSPFVPVNHSGCSDSWIESRNKPRLSTKTCLQQSRGIDSSRIDSRAPIDVNRQFDAWSLSLMIKKDCILRYTTVSFKQCFNRFRDSRLRLLML